jgi:hypothetical protein
VAFKLSWFSQAELASRIRITVDTSAIIAEQEIIALAADHGLGKDGYFSAASRGIDDIGWHRVPGRVATEPLDDLHALFYRRPEMTGTYDGITLVEVVGPDPYLKKPVHEAFHGIDVVIDPRKKNGLAPKGNTGV